MCSLYVFDGFIRQKEGLVQQDVVAEVGTCAKTASSTHQLFVGLLQPSVGTFPSRLLF